MFLHTFLLVFIAEMADKTQLMVMALTNRYKTSTVILGMAGGVFAISALSILAGDMIGGVIPMHVIELSAAILFLLFGINNLRISPEEKQKNYSFHFPILSIAFTFLLAELGDKTQVATVALAADHMDAHVWIFWGASLGLILANIIGIYAGKFIFAHCSEDSVKVVSSFIFFVFGSINLFEVLPYNTILICMYSITLISISYIVFMRSRIHNS